MNGVLAIDQGTTGTTCLVLDSHCRVVGRAYSEFRQHYPRPGWVEHDAAEIWHVTLRVAVKAIEAARKAEQALRVRSIGITNQRETVVVWDRQSGEPVHRAIVWQDRRTAPHCRTLRDAGHEDLIRSRTGLVLDPYFSATKLTWLLDNVDGLRKRAQAGELAFGTIDSWLVWKLSGGRTHCTDPTNASRTLLYDIRNLEWDDGLLELFGVPREMLPDVAPSSGDIAVADASLFGEEIPVAGIAGDQQAALFGQGCVESGQAKNTYGTGAFLLVNTGTEPVESKHGLLTTVACGPGGEAAYALEGSVFIAGAAIQWLRDELKIIDDAAATAEVATSIDGNDGVYFVPAFVGLGAPHWNAEARGTIVGLTRGSGRPHLVRAALEAMAYSTHDVLEAMIADSGVTVPALAVDGGASQNDWLMQFQADMIALPVTRPAMVETTALGAAGLAGLATGVWSDIDDFMASREAPSTFEPAMNDADRETCLRGWRRAVGAATTWADTHDD